MWYKLAVETENDPNLRQVKEHISTGWRQSNGPAPYHNFQQELTVVEGVILNGKRTVVPISMSKDMFERIYDGYIGPGKCKRRAREVLYWPSMV